MSECFDKWEVSVGPYGRGDVLVNEVSSGEAAILAPPGVPLDPPELVSRLILWRSATYKKGVVQNIVPVSVDTAIAQAPNQTEWIIHTGAQRILRDLLTIS